MIKYFFDKKIHHFLLFLPIFQEVSQIIHKAFTMGICQSNEKLNGIIDNQSSYEIIYHVSGSMKELTDYE